MGNKNTNLQMAKNAKDDEFYTIYETVEKEMAHYVQHFERKTVLCNCDDPFESNFCKFFLKNFNVLKLKRLICTSFSSSKVMGTQVALMDDDSKVLTKGNGYVLDITGICEGQGELSDEYVTQFLLQSKVIKKLKGKDPNGDPKFIIAEAKYGSSQLGNTKKSGPQMGDKWIKNNIGKIVDDPDDIIEGLATGDTVKELFRVNVSNDNGLVNVTTSVKSLK